MLRLSDLPEDAASQQQHENLYASIQQQVTAHPILSRTVFQSNSDCRSLVKMLLILVENQHCHATIKFLIQKNPQVLVYRSNDNDTSDSSLDAIALSRIHCVLLPWIAEHFSAVLDQVAHTEN